MLEVSIVLIVMTLVVIAARAVALCVALAGLTGRVDGRLLNRCFGGRAAAVLVPGRLALVPVAGSDRTRVGRRGAGFNVVAPKLAGRPDVDASSQRLAPGTSPGARDEQQRQDHQRRQRCSADCIRVAGAHQRSLPFGLSRLKPAKNSGMRARLRSSSGISGRESGGSAGVWGGTPQ